MTEIGWLSGTKDASEATTVGEALGQYGYDYEVELHGLTTRIYTGGKEIKRTIPDHKAVVRMSDFTPLAVVGDRYNPVQHLEAFGVLDVLVSRGELEIEKVQAVKDGRKMMIVSSSPEPLVIAGEPFTRYQAWLNGHDGKTPVVMVSVPTRDFCTNALPGLISVAGKEGGSYKIKHTRTAHTRLADAQQEIFGVAKLGEEAELEELTREYYDMSEAFSRREQQGLALDATNAMQKEARYVTELAKVGEDLASVKLSTKSFEDFLKRLVPIAPDASPQLVTRREDKRADIRSIWVSADDLGNVRDTAWGALQAVNMYVDHFKDYKSIDSKTMNLLQGDPLLGKALELLRN